MSEVQWELAKRIVRAAQLAQPIFAAHGWEWGVSYRPLKPGESYGVPTVEQIADTIKRLYDAALGSSGGSCSSGRLTVYVDEDDGSFAVDVQLADLRDEVTGWEGGVARCAPKLELQRDAPHSDACKTCANIRAAAGLPPVPVTTHGGAS